MWSLPTYKSIMAVTPPHGIVLFLTHFQKYNYSSRNTSTNYENSLTKRQRKMKWVFIETNGVTHLLPIEVKD